MNKHSKVLAMFLALSFVLTLAVAARLQAGDMVVDPVCGMEMKKSEAKVTYEYMGKTFYFCSEECKEKFIKMHEKHKEMNIEKEKMEMRHKEMMEHEKYQHSTCCLMCGLESAKDLNVLIEKNEDGVTVKITSKDAETVKKIHQNAECLAKECCKDKEGTEKEIEKKIIKKKIVKEEKKEEKK
jgi:YHS domain-containing protein